MPVKAKPTPKAAAKQEAEIIKGGMKSAPSPKAQDATTIRFVGEDAPMMQRAREVVEAMKAAGYRRYSQNEFFMDATREHIARLEADLKKGG